MPRGAAPRERRGGRAKGTPNKIPAEVRDALMNALRAGDGAVGFFLKLKEENPKVFATLVGKLLPRVSEISGPEGEPIEVAAFEDLSFYEQIEFAKRVALVLQLGAEAAGKVKESDPLEAGDSSSSGISI